jgi:hypothetical protein
MPGTPATTRTAPPRRFENYVLTRAVDPSVGLTNVAVNMLLPCSPVNTDTGGFKDPGLGDQRDGLSAPLPIGFDFQLDNIVYKKFVVSSHGWLALVDPTVTFTPSQVLASNAASATRSSASIRATFTSNAVLLAPWFSDSRTLVDDPTELSGFFSDDKVTRIQHGLDPLPPFVNQVAFGVRYFTDVRSPKGRRLVVRWAIESGFGENTASSVLSFEAVVYESGTIEFRYVPRVNNAGFVAAEKATVGVFMPGGTNRFRDFAADMGYRDGARQLYVYGGFVFSSAFTDPAVPFAVPFAANLNAVKHWPAPPNRGSVFAFSPPVNLRKVLPRREVRDQGSRLSLPLVARTGDDRLGTTLSSFDDRRSPQYAASGSSVVVSYPSTLPRFFGGTGLGTLERQDLFTGDFLVTASVSKSAIEPYVGEGPVASVPAFNESRHHEQDPSTLSSSFYTTGSSISSIGAGFDQPLKSKTQIRLQLPVNSSVQMPGLTSTIYYYNSTTKAWEVPAHSTYTIGDFDTLPPSPNPGAGGDWADPTFDATFNRIIEDARGFGPIGNLVASGSHTPGTNPLTDQTDASIGFVYSNNTVADNTFRNAFTRAIGHTYPKSVNNNDEYRPTQDETFTIPINAPFLIEKAVFEVPIAAGPGWFNDQTQCFVPIPVPFAPELFNPMGFDFAGPALTVALWRSVPLAESSDIPGRRDLILTGTIIPTGDNVSQLVFENFPAFDTQFQIRPVGFLGYSSAPGAVVDGGTNNAYTGSVVVPCTSLSSAGALVRLHRLFSITTGSVNSLVSDAILPILKNPRITLDLIPLTTVMSGGTTLADFQAPAIAYVNPIGRGGTGFDPAGRCILGQELRTLQSLVDQSGLTAPNPFFTGSISAQFTQTFNNLGALPTVNMVSLVQLISHFPSPYLVMPGDRLVLSISKMRPFLYSAATGEGAPPNFSGSFGATGHDIMLTNGTVNLTLYGSQVQAGVEYHDTLNQPLGSDAVHEVIGTEPVLDQFEVEYKEQFSGSFSDNVMLGALVTKLITDSSITLITGVRDRKLSKLNARQAVPLTTSSADLLINPSKAYRAQPWYERVDGVRPSQFVDDSERYFDSMMPNIATCFAADGAGIFVTSSSVGAAFASSHKVNINNAGWIWFDYQDTINTEFGLDPLVDSNWTKAFPFEPRYLAAARLLDISKGFLASYFYNPGGSPQAVPIPPILVNGFFFGPIGGLDVRFFITTTNNWVADADLSGKNGSGFYVTSSAARDDMARALYGFGDANNYRLQDNFDSTFSLVGTNHFATFRDQELPNLADGTLEPNTYLFSPIIRGWRYGVRSGLPTFSKCYWRHNKFGQFRDMLEQRPFTKYYQSPENDPVDPNFIQGVQHAPVTVKFLSSDGRLTPPANTASSNLSFECTSSFPYFDGDARNRSPIIQGTLNTNIVNVRQDLAGNITL